MAIRREWQKNPEKDGDELMVERALPRTDLGPSGIQRRFGAVSENAGPRPVKSELTARKGVVLGESSQAGIDDQHGGGQPVFDCLDDDGLRRELTKACSAAGSVEKWALSHDLTKQAVYVVLAGKGNPGPKIIEALGLEIIYRRRE